MHIRIGRHVVPLWLVGLVLGVAFVGAYATYVTLNVPLTILEPLEVLDYPPTLSLYPGETMHFNLTIVNHATLSYALILDFDIGNKTYTDSYVTTSNETYSVHPGTQSLAVWLKVSSQAPALNTVLKVSLRREPIEDFATEQLQVTNLQFDSVTNHAHIYVTVNNTGTTSVTINEAYVNGVKINAVVENNTANALPLSWAANTGKMLDITYSWTLGSNYEIKMISSKGNAFLRSGVAPA